jgi:prepilin-type N-terminal cleavage/methylation domain-containing protein
MYFRTHMRSHKRSAFTLIELLVVIAIIAVLAVVVVLSLNPAELLRQSRDSNRLSDLDTLTRALSLYTADQGVGSGFSLGTSSVTYISIPDPSATTAAGSDCSGLGFPAGGSFHCAGPSYYRKTDGTGWLPVNFQNVSTGAPLGSLPVDPTNQSSSDLYYSYTTDGSTFKLVANPESQKNVALAGTNNQLFRSGSNQNLGGGSNWVLVPGNSTFGTGNFWVMKYDAVCSDGKGNPYNDTNSSDSNNYHIYDNSQIPCTGSRQIAALPGGRPIADIWQSGQAQHNDAVSYCAAIGAHLITNNEWQTIAWNAESQSSNWMGGSVGGTGANAMYSGHNDNQPQSGGVAYALPADPNDANGYAGTDGPTSGGGTCASGCSTTQLQQKRTLTLSNGSIVWDIGGNVWDWTNDTILGKNEPTNGTPGFNWRAFSTADDGSGNGGITVWNPNGGTGTQQFFGPMTASWNANNGIGRIYSDGTATNNSTYAFLRGGSWYFGSYAGVEALNLNVGPGYTYDPVGFRCAR